MQDPQYATALATAAASNANLGGSPNGESSTIKNIQNLAQLQFRAGNVTNGTGALGAGAKVQADQEEANRKAAEAAAEAAAKIKEIQAKAAADAVDPANFKREVSDDGGYNFYDAQGKPITVQQYSKATGKQIPDALEGSQSLMDNQFKTDYKTLLEYGKAMAGDGDAVKSFKDSDAGKAFLSNPANKNKTYAEVVADFRNHYGTYLQPDQTNGLSPTNAQGQDIRNNAIDQGDPNFFANLFKTYQRNNVTYR